MYDAELLSAWSALDRGDQPNFCTSVSDLAIDPFIPQTRLIACDLLGVHTSTNPLEIHKHSLGSDEFNSFQVALKVLEESLRISALDSIG